jgi:hypothetical protein
MQNNAGWAVLNENMRLATLLSFFLIIGAPSHGAEFKGATEVLWQAAQASPKPKEKKDDPYTSERNNSKWVHSGGSRALWEFAHDCGLGIFHLYSEFMPQEGDLQEFNALNF